VALAPVDADERLDAQVADDDRVHDQHDSIESPAMETAAALLGAYLIGSISFAIVVSRVLRLPDPRSYGSRNPGMTNVLRTGRKAAAVLTLAGDAGKGWAAVWAASFLTAEAAFAGLAAFLGHLFPVFHRFRGGKGVATAAGVLFGLDWRLGVGTLAAWLVIAATLRYASLASIVAAVFAPFASALLLDWKSALIVGAMALLLTWRHRGNVARLFAGTEPRLGEKSPNPADPSAASR
jgi:glycerol-3-phosphate acyltransferase PlsY